jgi:hypothetical protein
MPIITESYFNEYMDKKCRVLEEKFSRKLEYKEQIDRMFLREDIYIDINT